jgi:tetratricopeptide (TPR) repeat protein
MQSWWKVILLSRDVMMAAACGVDDASGLDKTVIELYEAGRFSEAIPAAQQALALREKTLGTEHPAVAQSLNNLASLYQKQGRYAEAEPLHKRSLAIWEKAPCGDHPDVASSLNNLAELYRNQGRYAEAEPLYKRSLAIWESALGRDHPDVALSLNNMASLYHNRARYEDAEPLYRQSLAIREKALGRDHPQVAQSLNNLAELYRQQDRYAEADPLHGRSWAIEKVLRASRDRDDRSRRRKTATGTWLYDRTVPMEITIWATPAHLAFERFDDEDGFLLIDSRPIPETRDGFLYSCAPSPGGQYLTIDEAKAAADAQPWGPVKWD